MNLHNAVEQGDVRAVMSLLERGADVERRTERGDAPLHLAAANGNPEIVRLLLEKGADPNALSRERWTPLHYGALASGPKSDHRVVVESLCARGADVNAVNANGWTPLFEAAEGGCHDIVDALIGRGARVDVQDRQGWTALHVAAYHGKTDAFAALLKAGADPSIQSRSGTSAAEVADQEGHVTTVAAIRRLNGSGWTTIAALHGLDVVARTLTTELLDIGTALGSTSSVPTFATQAGPSSRREYSRRARQIGEEMYALGRNRTEFMRHVHRVVNGVLGREAGSELESCWDMIGETEWKAGRGECWMG